MNERVEAFFEDIGRSIDAWVKVAQAAVRDPTSADGVGREAFECLSRVLRTPEEQRAFELAVRDLLTGMAHSIMVTLDGRSAYSEEDSPQLSHSDGRPFVAD